MKSRASLSWLLVAAAGFSGCGSGGSGGTTTPPGSATYTVSGFVNNLNNSPMKLQDNGGDTITLETYGSFTFPTALTSGSKYDVTILDQPKNGETCAVQNGTGTVASQVTTVLINCYPPMTVGGLVFGLTGSGLALQNNGSDTLQIPSNGAFKFSSTINIGEAYDVTVLTQPVSPSQLCTVTNGSGSNEQSDVTNVLISCGSAEAKWAWMGGSQSKSEVPIYGQKGVPATGNNPGARWLEAGWTDTAGNFWIFGGNDGNGIGTMNDLWRYSNGEWAWISGSNTNDTAPGIYGTKGTPSATNVPGARLEASTWTDSAGSLWLFGGYERQGTNKFYNDLWRFSNNEWTWMSGSDQPNQPPVYGTLGVADPANVPGARMNAMTWVDTNGGLWLFGGWDVMIYPDGGSSRDQNDMWKYSGGEWTWMGGPNDPTTQSAGVYGTLGVPAPENIPGARNSGATWTDASGAFWLFGGQGVDSAGNVGALNDLWRYKDGEWTWMSGSKLAGDLGTFGTMGVPDPANVPPARADALSWTDAAGNLWLFGGGGDDRTGNDGDLNDLWRYSGGVWTYMNGSELARQPSTYGPLGSTSADSLPGGCSGKVGWTDKSGRFWAYCLNDNNQDLQFTSANDLWMYQP
jgi:hypothetical protein